MAYDDRYQDDRPRGRDRWRDEAGHAPGWRGDAAFGDGWGNQTPREGYRESHLYREEADLSRGGPGFDAGFGGSRRDRLDVGSAGRYAAHSISSPTADGYRFRQGYDRDRSRHRDPHYSEWRERQLAELDRDYEEYARENQSRFDREFGAWRSRRGEQREAAGRVTEHMEVVGSDGAHVGKVDKVRGDTLLLTRSDPNAGGVHHAVPCGWIERVDDKVTLNLTADEATDRWRTETRSRALFEREDSGSDGPHILNRSFSGTYRDE